MNIGLSKKDKRYLWWGLIISIFIVLFCFAVFCGCKNKEENKPSQNAYNCPCIVLTSTNEYLVVRNVSGEYKRVYNVVMVDKYKMGDTIK